jgi:hypothetical protein
MLLVSLIQRLAMVDTSEWFEARSSEEASTGIRRHLGRVIERIIGVAGRRQGNDDVQQVIATVPARPSGRAGPATARGIAGETALGAWWWRGSPWATSNRVGDPATTPA